MNKYLDLAGELKKPWKMSVTVILIVDGALRTVSKNLERRLEEWEIRERIEILLAIALLRSIIILRRVLET